MNEQLKNAATALREIDPSLSPVVAAQVREDALIQGLQGLAAEFGKAIGHTRIDGNGDMRFTIIDTNYGDRPGVPCGQYGEKLAELLSLVPRRTGVHHVDTPVLPENGWCYINHFDVERLIAMAMHRLVEPDGPSTSMSP